MQPQIRRDADIFRTGTLFYRHYKGLHPPYAEGFSVVRPLAASHTCSMLLRNARACKCILWLS